MVETLVDRGYEGGATSTTLHLLISQIVAVAPLRCHRGLARIEREFCKSILGKCTSRIMIKPPHRGSKIDLLLLKRTDRYLDRKTCNKRPSNDLCTTAGCCISAATSDARAKKGWIDRRQNLSQLKYGVNSLSLCHIYGCRHVANLTIFLDSSNLADH